MSFKKQAALLAGAAAATIAGLVLTHKFLLPEMFAVKPENVLALDRQDEPKSVDQVVDVTSSELTIVESQQAQEQEFTQESPQEVSFSTEIAEETHENTGSNLEQYNVVEQVTEELNTLEQPLQEQESTLANLPVEKGYWDTAKSYFGLGDSQETVEVVTAPEESTIVVEQAVAEVSEVIETITVEEPIVVEVLETKVSEVIIEIPVVVEALEVIEPVVVVTEELQAIVETAEVIESVTVEESVAVEVLEAKVAEVIIEIPVVVEELEVIEPVAVVTEEPQAIVEIATVIDPVTVEEPVAVEVLETKVSEVIEVAVEESSTFDSGIDVDGNPVMVIPSVTQQKEHLANDGTPCNAMTPQEEFASEDAKLNALKDEYGWGYFGNTTLEKIEEQEKKVAEIAEVVKTIEDENSWNCLLATQRDLEEIKVAQEQFDVRIQDTHYGIHVLKQKIEKAQHKNVASYQQMLSIMETELSELVEKKEKLKNS